MMLLQVLTCITLRVLTFSRAAHVEACHEEQDCGPRDIAKSQAMLQVDQGRAGRAAVSEGAGVEMCIVRDNNCSDLLLDSTWNDGVTQNQAPHLTWMDAQLVVARYDEDLRWLDALPQIPTVVYNRGESTSTMLPSPRENLHIIQQPNRGREDQVFLEHIVNNYERLPQATVFLQGWPFGHCPGFLYAVRRALTHVLRPEMAGPQTAGYLEGLAPVTSTFWQYNTENGRLGLAASMAKKNLPLELGHVAEELIRSTYSSICSKLLGGKPCPSFQWVSEGAQWAVSRKRIQSTPLHVYESSMGLGEGWEGKFRGLVLEAIWPLVFGATDWEPTQVEYLPTLSAEANNRARSNDDYCELLTGTAGGSSFLVDLDATSMDGESAALNRRKARHLIFSCTQRAEYCERQLQSGQNTSMLWLKERERFEIHDPMGMVPWYMKAQLRPVLYGLSLWWPRNSFQAHRNLHAVSDKGYAPIVVEMNSSVQLPENDWASETDGEWIVSNFSGGFAFSRINQWEEQHFLGCKGQNAAMLPTPVAWDLIPLLDGWLRLYNPQAGKYLSLDDRRDGGFLYCMQEYPNPDISEQAAFYIDPLPKSK